MPILWLVAGLTVAVDMAYQPNVSPSRPDNIKMLDLKTIVNSHRRLTRSQSRLVASMSASSCHSDQGPLDLTVPKVTRETSASSVASSICVTSCAVAQKGRNERCQNFSPAACVSKSNLNPLALSSPKITSSYLKKNTDTSSAKSNPPQSPEGAKKDSDPPVMECLGVKDNSKESPEAESSPVKNKLRMKCKKPSDQKKKNTDTSSAKSNPPQSPEGAKKDSDPPVMECLGVKDNSKESPEAESSPVKNKLRMKCKKPSDQKKKNTDTSSAKSNPPQSPEGAKKDSDPPVMECLGVKDNSKESPEAESSPVKNKLRMKCKKPSDQKKKIRNKRKNVRFGVHSRTLLQYKSNKAFKKLKKHTYSSVWTVDCL